MVEAVLAFKQDNKLNTVGEYISKLSQFIGLITTRENAKWPISTLFRDTACIILSNLFNGGASPWFKPGLKIASKQKSPNHRNIECLMKTPLSMNKVKVSQLRSDNFNLSNIIEECITIKDISNSYSELKEVMFDLESIREALFYKNEKLNKKLENITKSMSLQSFDELESKIASITLPPLGSSKTILERNKEILELKNIQKCARILLEAEQRNFGPLEALITSDDAGDWCFLCFFLFQVLETVGNKPTASDKQAMRHQSKGINTTDGQGKMDLGSIEFKEKIQEYCKRVEQKLIDVFEDGFKERNKTTMRNAFLALRELKKEHSCVQLYIYNLDIFKEPVQMAVNDEKTIDLDFFVYETNSFTNLISEIRDTYENYLIDLGTIFPNESDGDLDSNIMHNNTDQLATVRSRGESPQKNKEKSPKDGGDHKDQGVQSPVNSRVNQACQIIHNKIFTEIIATGLEEFLQCNRPSTFLLNFESCIKSIKILSSFIATLDNSFDGASMVEDLINQYIPKAVAHEKNLFDEIFNILLYDETTVQNYILLGEEVRYRGYQIGEETKKVLTGFEKGKGANFIRGNKNVRRSEDSSFISNQNVGSTNLKTKDKNGRNLNHDNEFVFIYRQLLDCIHLSLERSKQLYTEEDTQDLMEYFYRKIGTMISTICNETKTRFSVIETLQAIYLITRRYFGKKFVLLNSFAEKIEYKLIESFNEELEIFKLKSDLRIKKLYFLSESDISNILTLVSDEVNMGLKYDMKGRNWVLFLEKMFLFLLQSLYTQIFTLVFDIDQLKILKKFIVELLAYIHTTQIASIVKKYEELGLVTSLIYAPVDDLQTVYSSLSGSVTEDKIRRVLKCRKDYERVRQMLSLA